MPYLVVQRSAAPNGILMGLRDGEVGGDVGRVEGGEAVVGMDCM